MEPAYLRGNTQFKGTRRAACAVKKRNPASGLRRQKGRNWRYGWCIQTEMLVRRAIFGFSPIFQVSTRAQHAAPLQVQRPHGSAVFVEFRSQCAPGFSSGIRSADVCYVYPRGYNRYSARECSSRSPKTNGSPEYIRTPDLGLYFQLKVRPGRSTGFIEVIGESRRG